MVWSDLVDQLVAKGVLKTPEVARAFSKLDRSQFMRPENQLRADEDRPFSIGYGQTISQPTTVAFMIELLKIEKDNRVLDVGSGSGWTTALMAELAGERGRVYATETLPKLKEFGENNVKKAGYRNVEFYTSNGSLGLAQKAPFDCILCSATVPKIPQPLKNQLAENNGRLVIPVGEFTSSVFLVRRLENNTYTQKEFPGFAFVPLKGRHGF